MHSMCVSHLLRERDTERCIHIHSIHLYTVTVYIYKYIERKYIRIFMYTCLVRSWQHRFYVSTYSDIRFGCSIYWESCFHTHMYIHKFPFSRICILSSIIAASLLGLGVHRKFSFFNCYPCSITTRQARSVCAFPLFLTIVPESLSQ